MQYYDRPFVFIDGQLEGEAESVSVQYQGDYIQVDTLVKDLAGFTPVPKSVLVEVNSFVPAAGFSVDAVKLWAEGKLIKVRVQWGGSGKKMTCEGVMQAPQLSGSATDSSRITFRVLGEAKLFE